MISIRVLKEDELNLFFKHSNDAKIETEELHLRCQYIINPEDFFIAHKETDIVGFIIALRQSDEFGFISTLLVLEKFRSCGYGTKLLNYALEHLDNRQVALDSTNDAKSIYERAGFKSYFDLHTFLHITKKHTKKTQDLDFVNYDECNSQNKQNKYLKCLLSNEDTNYKAIQKNKIITSYGISFKHNDGYKIVIDSTEYNDAKLIFFELIKKFEVGTSIYIEATKLNPIFLSLADELKMTEYAKYARMYNKIL